MRPITGRNQVGTCAAGAAIPPDAALPKDWARNVCSDAGRKEPAMDHREFDPIQKALGSRRQAMLRDLEAMSRRELLRRGGRLAAGVSAASLLLRAGFPIVPTMAQGTPAAAEIKLPDY